MIIRINQDVYTELKKYVLKVYPLEACGMLLGYPKSDLIEKAVFLHNGIGGEKGRRGFFVNPAELYSAEIIAAKSGFEPKGFFHSHPDCEAVFSEEDALNMIPGLIYLILPVTREGTGKMRGYIKDPSDGKIQEIKVACGEKQSHESLYFSHIKGLF